MNNIDHTLVLAAGTHTIWFRAVNWASSHGNIIIGGETDLSMQTYTPGQMNITVFDNIP